ncbi:MAG: hypothetical protein HC898_03830 [Phycisphaerales bacterium]|nr:hypothetical protein [Phycisphaerales bacterium]
MKRAIVTCLAVISSLSTTTLLADTSPYLMLQPWGEGEGYFQSVDKPIFLDAGKTEATNRRTEVMSYESAGRARFNKDQRYPEFSVGYRVNSLETGLSDPLIPKSFLDIAFAAGVQLGQVAPDWTLSLVGGVGIATDTHFDNEKAIYGIGSLNARWTITEKQTLDVGLAYNGNRSIFPDVPLPYAVFTHNLSPELMYAVGVPLSRIVWRPVEDLTLTLGYMVPYNINFEAAYQICSGFRLRWLRGFAGCVPDGSGGHAPFLSDAQGACGGADWC